MNFIIQNSDTGNRYSVDISEYKSFEEMVDAFKEDPRFGESDFRFIDAEDEEGQVFLKGDFLDSKVFDYFHLDYSEKEAARAWYKDFGGSDEIKWVLNAFVAKCEDDDEYRDFLYQSFSIPENIERFIDFDAVKREGEIIFQVARDSEHAYYIFQRH